MVKTQLSEDAQSFEGINPPGRDLLQQVFLAMPAWLFSAVIHVAALVILLHIVWEVKENEVRNIAVNLTEQQKFTVDEPPQPKSPEFIEETEFLPPEIQPVHAAYTSPDIEYERPNIDLPVFVISYDEPQPNISHIGLGESQPSTGIPSPFKERFPDHRIISPDYDRNAENSILRGLRWLASVQESDGRWDSRKWGANQDADAAVSGLALLAFLGHGNTDRSGEFRTNVFRALEYLESVQKPDGHFGRRFYTQGICTMATAQAYAMSGTKRWGAVAQKSLDYCAVNQNPNGGWDYTGSNPNRVDTSVTAWVVLGIKSGVIAGLDVPEEATDRIRRWSSESLNADGTTGYTKVIGGQGTSAGTPSMTAAATVGRIFTGWQATEVHKAMEYINRHGVNINDLYYTYYASLAMFQIGSDFWDQWKESLCEPLERVQARQPGNEFYGSWPPDTKWGGHGGRVYTTALSIMCLEAPYIYEPMLR